MSATNVVSQSAEQREPVQASLNYLAEMAEKPYTYTYTPPPGVAQTNRRVAPHAVPIRDARAITDRLSLDREGFALTHHKSVVSNFYDDDEVRAVYYPECERLLQEATGAVRVVVFDHIVRCATRARRGEKGIKEPAKGVHNDYTLHSGPQRLRDLLPDEAEALLQNRFAIINVWRPIRGPVQESPLAVCDAQSIRLDDFVASDLIYPHRRGETYAVTFNPNHRWYYCSDMQPDEALLLKCYDSATDGRARFTAHTGFDDPTSPPDAAPRESIETRAFVFFAPEK
ncbi:MAG: methyltransferase [Deltaproteobacteria bacterium]|nr:methyltransferase [Deltaproteobacteria bacterium]